MSDALLLVVLGAAASLGYIVIAAGVWITGAEYGRVSYRAWNLVSWLWPVALPLYGLYRLFPRRKESR